MKFIAYTAHKNRQVARGRLLEVGEKLVGEEKWRKSSLLSRQGREKKPIGFGVEIVVTKRQLWDPDTQNRYLIPGDGESNGPLLVTSYQ